MDIVDQYYWLGYAKKEIDNASDNLNAAASKISTLVATFWTIYTTTFIIGAGIKKLDESLDVFILLILPVPLMMLSYITALWAQMPTLSLDGIDPRAPDDVMNYYSRNLKSKKIRVWIALLIFFAAGLSLTTALIFANFTKEKNDRKSIILITAKNDKLTLSGDLKNRTMVKYEVKTSSVIFKKDSIVILQNDHFECSTNAPKGKPYQVNVSWRDQSDTTIMNAYSQYFPIKKK